MPDPKAQVEQITTALIYKFMDDMDREAINLGGEARFFSDGFAGFRWPNLLDNSKSGKERLELYVDAITKMSINPHIPRLFQEIFKDAFLPYNDPQTLSLFLKEINHFSYDNSENLGNAFEYLLSVLGSQGEAGQFRTPRHIIDFIVEIVDPKKNETILDPACGTAGFLISAYKHIVKHNSSNYSAQKVDDLSGEGATSQETVVEAAQKYNGDKLTPDERNKLIENFVGYDISPDMVKLSLVNMYLHGFANPKILEYDTLTSERLWDDDYDVILANPPFMSPKGGIRPHNRFQISAKRSEVLFVDYIAEHLSINGRAGVIVPEGIIFQSQNAYKDLRKMLVDSCLWAVVSLPTGVFRPYSGVKTSILLMDKALAKKTDDILFVKIEMDGFDLGAQRRKIDKNDLPKALEIIREHKQSILDGNKDKNIGHSEYSEESHNTMTKQSPPGHHGQSAMPADRQKSPNGHPEQSEGSLIHTVPKAKIKESGDYSLTGDRYKAVVDYTNIKWPMVKLGDVAEYINGFAFKPTDWKPNGKKIIRIQNLTGTNKEYNYTDRTDIKDKYVVRSGDLLISWSATIGFFFWKEDDAYLNQHIFKVVPSHQIIKKYFYFLKDRIIGEITGNVHGNTMKHITKGRFDDINIPLPPLEIQEQIVEELDGYQNVIDGARQVVENYKPTINIDPNWETIELGLISENLDGKRIPIEKSKRKPGQYPYYGASGIVDHVDSYLFDEEILLISEDGANLLARTTPIAFSVKGKVWVNNHAHVLKFKNSWTQNYVEVFLNSISLEDYITGSAQPKLNQKQLSLIKVPLPSDENIKKIVAEIEEEQKIVSENKKLIEIFEQKIKSKISEIWGE